MTVVIGAVVIVYAAYLAALFRFGKPWVNPMFVLLLYYLFNYPVRAYLLVEFPENFNDRYAFTDAEILTGLAYSTCYVIIFAGVYLLMLKHFSIRLDFAGLHEGALDRKLFYVTAFLVLLSGVITMGYEVSVGGSFSLGSDIEGLRRPFWVNVTALPYSLKWFSTCMGFLLLLTRRSLGIVVMTALLLAMGLAEAFLTTAKGVIVSFLLLFLFLDNLVTGRILRVSVLVIGALFAVVFSSYSYYARLSGGVGLASVQEYLDTLNLFLSEDLWEAIGSQFENIAFRATYYFDALPLMSRTDPSATAGVYAFGSLIELVNLVPRAFGIVTEQYSFDRHVTFAVWGETDFSQIFIGRIGESFFVLGFAGLLYALLHAGVFAYVASLWRRLSGDIGGISLYVAILLGWLYQDASLTYQAKNLIAILLGYCLAKLVVRLLASASQGTAPQGA